jgi:elongation factor Ts
VIVEIKASQVKELRDMTGVAMMDCKKALVECEGDIEKALDLLRSNSALKAEKKSSRVAADGILVVSVNEDYATLVELNSETDFAAKDANFLSFGEKVKEYISKNKIFEASVLKESSLEDDRKALVQTIGENIQIRRVVTLEFDSTMNIGIYIHSDSKLGSLVVTKDGSDEIAKDIAMHVSAFNPLCLSQDDIDKDVLEREKAIYQNQAQDSGKPQDIMDKMVDGKVKRFLSEVSLISQNFVKDPDITVQEYLEKGGATIVEFARLKVGEGIEVETKDFAEEVAEQLK